LPTTWKPSEPSEDRHVPTAFVGSIEPGYYCRGWNAKREKYCRNRAGLDTDHPGVGRCKFHGGNNKPKSGRYSKLLTTRVGQLLDEHAGDDAPLDLTHELHLARALLQDFVERTAEDRDAAQLAEAIRLIGRIAGIVDTIEKIKTQNAITPADFNRLMTNMGLVVRQFVTDDDTCKRIQDGWLALRV
jgi:hypothetical protein